MRQKCAKRMVLCDGDIFYVTFCKYLPLTLQTVSVCCVWSYCIKEKLLADFLVNF